MVNDYILVRKGFDRRSELGRAWTSSMCCISLRGRAWVDDLENAVVIARLHECPV